MYNKNQGIWDATLTMMNTVHIYSSIRVMLDYSFKLYAEIYCKTKSLYDINTKTLNSELSSFIF